MLTGKARTRIRNNNYTMIEAEGLEVLLSQVAKAPDGVIVVAGTAHGGDIMAIRRRFPTPPRHIIAIDSFSGVAEPVEIDGPEAPKAGAHNNGGLDQYLANFKEAGVDPPDEIFKMWITDSTLKQVGKRDVAMLFMDLDHYTPVMACLKYFHPMMLPGGRIITHDYGFRLTKGVKKACQEFAPDRWKQARGFAVYDNEA
jgi:hypothetical protein